MIDVQIESGIEVATTRVLRQDPRKRRIIAAVNPPAMAPSRSTSKSAELTKIDWSKSGLIWRSLGKVAAILGNDFSIRDTTSKVEASPFLSTGKSAALI